MNKIPKQLCFLLSILATTVVSAQTNTDLDEALWNQYNKTVGSLNKINITQKKEIKKVADQYSDIDQMLLESLEIFNKAMARQKKELLEEREYQKERNSQQKHIGGDFVQLISGMPAPISDLGQAKQAMKTAPGQSVFSKYKDKLESSANQLQQSALASYPDNLKDPGKLEQDAKANARQAEQALSSNAMIQEMGGMEKLKNMSQAEREALGKQMAAKMKQNPNDYLPQGDPKKVFARKLMTDPSYKARYDHMNPQQQEEEYKIFMTDNGFVNTSAVSSNTKGDRTRALTSIEIEKRISLIRKHSQEMADVVGKMRTATDNYFENLKVAVGRQYGRYVKSLPEVEHGEAGKSKDTYQAEITYQIVMLPINAQHAVANKEVWMRYVDILKITMDEYNELLADYWNKDAATDLIMQQKHLTPAGISFGLCSELISLTRQAGEMTSHHAGWKIAYDEKVLQLYE